MINPFIIKKYAALMVCAMVTTICYSIGTMFYGLLAGIGTMFIGLILSVILGNLLLKTPFSLMLEGKGLLVINLDSTGILRPFIVKVLSPYITGKLGNKNINDVFDRGTVMQMAAPIQNGTAAPITEGVKAGGIKIEIDEQAYNKGRFALFHYPVLLYNEQINSVITKDFISEIEKDTFAEHGVLYLNRKMEELTSITRDFARHVVESLKPKENFFANKWVWLIIFIFIIIIVVMFAPSIIESIGVTGGGVGSALDGFKGQGAIIPK